MSTDRAKGKLGRAWPLILIVAMVVGGILAIKSSPATGQPETQIATAGQEPMSMSAAEEPPRTQPAEAAELPHPASRNTAAQTTPHVQVEVIHFHGTHQCYSCKMVGALAEKTVQTHFRRELRSGRIVFAHVNGQLTENREMVRKYGARSASLWIGTYVGGVFYPEQNLNVWYKIEDEGEFVEYLGGLLEKRLRGDLS